MEGDNHEAPEGWSEPFGERRGERESIGVL